MQDCGSDGRGGPLCGYHKGAESNDRLYKSRGFEICDLMRVGGGRAGRDGGSDGLGGNAAAKSIPAQTRQLILYYN